MNIEHEHLRNIQSATGKNRKTLDGWKGKLSMGLLAINGITTLAPGGGVNAKQYFEYSPSPIEEFTPNITSISEAIPLTEIAHQPKVSWEISTGPGSEPTIAASPFDSKLIAVTHQHVKYHSGCDLSGIRISQDGGHTFEETETKPWKGNCPDFHGQIAWGPGKIPGSSRLWWADAIIVGNHKVAAGVTYSDDLGKTWSKLYKETRTPPWVGGFPDITVDNNKDSPNFGTAYVAYNWLESSKGPGLAVLASGDNGKSWQITQVPPVGLKGYPDEWRIGYRLKTEPDGSVIVTTYQSNLLNWNPNNIFSQGGPNNIGREGFATALLHFDRKSKQLTADPPVWALSLSSKNLSSPFNPQWQTGLDIDQNSGRVWMSVSDRTTKNVIRIGYSDNKAQDWNFKTLGVEKEQNFKPSIAAENGVVFVGFHTTDSKNTVGTYFTFSYDNGKTFLKPKLITPHRYSQSFLNGVVNGTGLRENATFGSNGEVYFAYGVALAGGKTEVRVAVIKP